MQRCICIVFGGLMAANTFVPSAAAEFLFRSPRSRVTTGYQTTSVAITDYTGDGIPDLVAAKRAGSRMVVYRGLGGLQFFSLGTSLPVFFDPESIIATEFNGDGIPDFVFFSPYQYVSTQTSSGRGRFTERWFNLYNEPGTHGVLADINGDGLPDLVGIGGATMHGVIQVLLGRQDGGFDALPRGPIGPDVTGAHDIVAGDLNGDGRNDVVVSAGDQTNVLVANADGSFAAALAIAVTAGGALTLADFDTDGHLDLAICDTGHRNPARVYVLRGRGDSTFEPRTAYDVGDANLRASTSVDLDSDGDLDLIATDADNARCVVLDGQGDGTFAATIGSLPAGTRAVGVLAADLDNDGRPEIVLPGGDDNAITILPNPATAITPLTYECGPNPHTPRLADLDHDGNLDLIVSNPDLRAVSVRHAAPGGGFEPRVQFPTGGMEDLGDVNNDGWLDVIAIDAAHGGWRIWEGQESLGFQPGTSVEGPSPHRLMLADLDADGAPEIIGLYARRAGVAPPLVGVNRNDGHGHFEPTAWFECSDGPEAMQVADFDRDGRVDVAVACSSAGVISLHFGNGDATFAPEQHFIVEPGPIHLVSADINRDGNMDLVVGHAGSEGLYVHRGDGHGGFSAGLPVARGVVVDDLSTFDVDLDGLLDHIIVDHATGNVSVYASRIPGTRLELLLDAPTGVAIGDIDDDHVPDLVVTDDNLDGVWILINGMQTTAVGVEDLQARLEGGTARLQWRVPVAGLASIVAMHVERASQSAGPWARCTPTSLAAAPFMSWSETPPSRGPWWYRLEWMDTQGGVSNSVPVALVASGGIGRSQLRAPIVPATSGSVQFRYVLAASARPRLALFDVRGRRLWSFQAGLQEPGEHAVVWDRRDPSGSLVARGVYILELEAGGVRDRQRFALLQR